MPLFGKTRYAWKTPAPLRKPAKRMNRSVKDDGKCHAAKTPSAPRPAWKKNASRAENPLCERTGRQRRKRMACSISLSFRLPPDPLGKTAIRLETPRGEITGRQWGTVGALPPTLLAVVRTESSQSVHSRFARTYYLQLLPPKAYGVKMFL